MIVEDGLRARLRTVGVELTDEQTEGAYAARLSDLKAAHAASGDYMLTDEAMGELQAAFGRLTVDAFASGATARLPRYWSAAGTGDARAEAVDAFAQPWAHERLLVNAPVSAIADVVARLVEEPRAAAVVVCPYWTGAPWFAPLARLAADSILLPPGSLRGVMQHTAHVRSWRMVAFYVERRAP